MAEGKANSVFSNHAVCLVLDYGSQYTQLIARRIRDNGVLSMLLPGDVSLVRYTQLIGLFVHPCVMQFLITNLIRQLVILYYNNIVGSY